ncbi:UDP-glycosyltransferase 205A1-like protein [Dinothrombium tinctorium]|nr:UDP-glycosyltransferase 205A1-like protein [Dinothrombium tinctorium]RWS00249.1 UDP-glycosyltransferase 205A1-like protein [Dinothrombium tinctorium]
MKSIGAPKLREDKFQYLSANLNLYIYPDALMEDYLKLCPLDQTWMGLSHALRDKLNPGFQLPEKLRSLPGKLIYFSLGSIGSSVVELMKRMISILSKSKHRFIMAKGHTLADYELPPNIWGDTFVPQIEILPLVDLVITHGGNNTISETLYFGKPFIILPLFADQHDNAQRAIEKRIGLRFNPFTVGEEELLNAIESLLLDADIHVRIAKISKEMHESKSMERVVNRIEEIAENPTLPPLIEQK